ncbi:poly(rC)-binding protein 3-like [Scomber scombrus]|uniref:poly(rC)-binding protein 3-like n=1 Tax=Scomber scombrus TaxID=13677 RepID=UPI002DD825E7|nr:poly(rC)-binding protein 3-like [Scomber scombrus]
MRLPAAESTHTSTHHHHHHHHTTFTTTSTTTMSSEQEFGDGAMGVTLTLRLLMHGKEVGSIIGKVSFSFLPHRLN